MKKTIDIILPCYNPSDTWYEALLKFNAYAASKYNLEYILVNDGSIVSKIPEQIEWLRTKAINIRYVSYEKNHGKGYALRQGVLVSDAEFIIYTDVDFPFTDQSTEDVIKTLLDGNCDVVAGFRNQEYYLKTMSAYRKILSRAFRNFIKHILKLPVSDTQCGLKGFNVSGKKKFLETTINRYLFDFEFIYASVKDPSIRLQTVPVSLKEGVVFSKMKLKILFQELFNLFYVLIFKKT